jgi:foldase protein PrsA
MKSWKSIPALCAFFVASLALAACGSGIAGNSVADMAGNPITLQAFNHWMFLQVKSLSAQSPGSPLIVPNDPPQFTACIAEVRKQLPSYAKQSDKALRADCNNEFMALSSRVMNSLLTSYWLQAEAAREHIKVTDAQVQKEFATERDRAYPGAQFDTFLKQSGLTIPDILFQVRVSLIETKLLAKFTSKVSSAQINSYYKSHLSQFGTPQTRDIRIVLTKTRAQALKAQQALKSGQSWKSVAKKYSTDPSKTNGGLLPGVQKGQEDQALDQAAFSAPINKLLGPVKGQFGFYVFEVTKVTKATQQTLAQATPLIQEQLTGQAQSSAQNSLFSALRKHWLTKTTCRTYYKMNDCHNYKAPKGSSTSTTATSTP